MPNNLNNKILSLCLSTLVATGVAYAEEKKPESKVNTDKAEKSLNLNIDKSKWKCKYCPDNEDEPWFVETNVGLGLVSNNSYKFGEYNGLYKKGAFLILDVDAMYRDENANYFDIKTDKLGLETRRVEMEGGKQGKYKIEVLVDQINKYNLDTSRTPYNGTSNQTLPAGWVDGSDTSAAQMTALLSSLHNINYSTKRRHLKVSSNYIHNAKWNYDVKFKRQTKEGKTPFAAAIGSSFATANAAVLAKPIDYTTDTFELSANYNHNDIHGSVSFINSTFKNKNKSLTWDNAFTTATNANNGKIALEPDNAMQQLMLSGQYRGVKNILVNGLFSIAKLTQNQIFLPYTSNGTLGAGVLPTKSLDGSVDVANANVNVNWTLNEKSKINFIFEHQEQANNTDRATYTYVVADNSITGTARANFPYSFQTQKLKVKSSYKLENKNKITGGISYSVFDRTYQEVNRSAETSLWVKYAQRLSSDVNYSVKVENDTRKANSYNVLAEVSPAENVQLRKYNLADNNILKTAFNINFSATDKLFMNVNIDQSNNKYSNSNVGLTKSDDLSIGVDAQFTVSDEISLSGYVQQSTIKSIQNGSTIAAASNWSAENKDTYLTIGIGSSYNVIEDELSIGLDLVHTDANGKITMSGASVTPLPDLVSKRDSIRLYGDYTYDENMTFKLSYVYEEYKEENWNLDSVTPSTINNVLSLGEVSPNYKIGVIWANMKYLF